MDTRTQSRVGILPQMATKLVLTSPKRGKRKESESEYDVDWKA